jgi:hypothetical protein
MLTIKAVRRYTTAILCCAATAMIAAGARLAFEPPLNEAISRATEAVSKQSREAEFRVRNLLARSPKSPEGLWLLANLYAKQGDRLGAYVCFRDFPNSHPNWAKARLAEGDQLFDLGDALSAEDSWIKASRDSELRFDAEGRLLALYGIQLRRDEWSQSLWKLIAAGRSTLREVVQIIILEHVVWQGEGIIETLQQFVSVNANDELSRASLVHHLLATGRPTEAKEQLDELLKRSPMSLHGALAAAAYAVAEADSTVLEPFQSPARSDWRLELQKSAIWKRYLGELELLRRAPAKAVPLLQEAASKAPFHPTGRQQLALALRLLGRMDEAELHAAAANTLARLDRSCHSMLSAGTWTPDEALGVVRDAASVGMIVEAKAWVRFAQKQQPLDERWQKLLTRLEAEPQTSRNSPPAAFLDSKRELKRW